MSRSPDQDRVASFEQIIAMARSLGRPAELREVLQQVVDTGRRVLRAERASVLLLDRQTGEFYSEATSAREQIRFPATQGIAGETLQRGRLIRIEDAYEDPRFNPAIDRATGYRTRSMISLPLIGVDDEAVGVMQLLNAEDGVFLARDERLAETFAVFAALAVQRAQAYQDRMRKAKLERDLDLARTIQMNLLPKELPAFEGYEVAVFSRPAEETGGDIFDLFRLEEGRRAGELMILLADATGHGIGAAVSVTQLRAMVRVTARLGVELDTLCLHLNNQLVADLPSNKFVTTFVGALDADRHRIVYRSLGQAPLLHYQADHRRCAWLPASGPPAGLIPAGALDAPEPIDLAPGDLFVLLSDGFYEYENPAGEELGKERVAALMDRHRSAGAEEILAALRQELERFCQGAPQQDDLTAIVLKRRAG